MMSGGSVLVIDTFVTVMLITTPIWFIRTSLVELMVIKPFAETSCGWPMRNQQSIWGLTVVYTYTTVTTCTGTGSKLKV